MTLSGATLADAGLWYGCFLVSIVCHEAAHAFAGRELGETTASRAGFASLNPWVHLRRSPIGMIATPLASLLFWGNLFGWASVEVNLVWMILHPRRAIAILVAGPCANLLLALLGALAIALGLHFRWLVHPAYFSDATVVAAAFPAAGSRVAARGLSIFFSLNLSLFLFNLLPLPFLDGGRIGLLLLGAYRAKLSLWGRKMIVLLLFWIFFNALRVAEGIQRATFHLFYPHPLAALTSDRISDFVQDAKAWLILSSIICGFSLILIFALERGKRRWRPPPSVPSAGKGPSSVLAV